MAKLSEQQQEFFRNPYYGVVTTLRADGSPHNTVVWVDVDEDAVIFNTAEGRAKPEHLRNDARAALIVVDPQNPFKWLAVSGHTELSHEGADEQIDKLSEKYTGNAEYQSRQPGEQRVNVRIAPEHVDSSGFSL
ncbi:MAG: PPOX class F420-dependent oxidoreductase [Actinobacteria bacterium]|nr:PPOX class F420-dependent oxidoreductase [Actinomycetota bacterium]